MFSYFTSPTKTNDGPSNFLEPRSNFRSCVKINDKSTPAEIFGINFLPIDEQNMFNYMILDNNTYETEFIMLTKGYIVLKFRNRNSENNDVLMPTTVTENRMYIFYGEIRKISNIQELVNPENGCVYQRFTITFKSLKPPIEYELNNGDYQAFRKYLDKYTIRNEELTKTFELNKRDGNDLKKDINRINLIKEEDKLAFVHFNLETSIKSNYKFDMDAEMRRILNKSNSFDNFLRIINYQSFNQDADYTLSYPAILYIPIKFLYLFQTKRDCEQALKQVCHSREKNRFPALSYSHGNGSHLFRGAQPLTGTGLSNMVSSAAGSLLSALGPEIDYDAELLKVMGNPVIFDARTLSQTYFNMLTGGGYKGRTQNAHVSNIHDLRSMFEKMAACEVDTPAQAATIKTYQQTWTRVLFEAIENIVKNLLNGENIMVHCSSGWDRTPQFSSLPMLYLDEHYRTIRGFADLIEKEWVSFGHQFGLRCANYTETSKGLGEQSGIFLQFLHCVKCWVKEEPNAFEFNKKLLRFLAKHTYSLLYRNFMFGNEAHREAAKTFTRSIWDDVFFKDKNGVAHTPNVFINKNYSSRKLSRNIFQSYAPVHRNHLWKGFLLL